MIMDRTMRMLFPLLLILCVLFAVERACADTLRHHDGTGEFRYTRHGDIFAERFRTDRPLLVRSVTLRIVGPGNATATEYKYRLRILGGNAGNVFPTYRDDLIEPIEL